MNMTKRVLVVDDDPIVAQCFDHVLAPKGYAVIYASDGNEALDRIANESYDMVYTDIKMPGMSGIEVARRIRESRPWLPVVIVTGYGTTEQREAAKKIGVRDFIDKPLSPEVIEESAATLTADAATGPGAEITLEATAFSLTPYAEAATPDAPAARTALRRAGQVGLFFAAPFIGLIYIVVGPLVGLGLLGWMGVKALARRAGI